MQKIQSYLYPNRTILLADLAGFTVENRVVYARTIKIYNGVDNVLEFDIQNVDQKRIDLTTLGSIEVNIMDVAGNALSNSPYQMNLQSVATATNATVVATNGKSTSTTITIPTANITGTFSVNYQITGTNIQGPVMVVSVNSDIDSATTTLGVSFQNQTVSSATGLSINNIVKGLGNIVIPQEDLADLAEQYLTYSVTAIDSFGNQIMLYSDSQFGAPGKIQLINNAMPQFRDEMVYDSFVGEINYMGNVINHTPAIPCKFYQAEPVQFMNFDITLNNFIGTVYVEATEDMTIAVSSFINAQQIQSFTCTTATTRTISFYNVPVTSTGGQYNFMRISWQYPDVWQWGSQQNPTLQFGSVTKVVAYS
jgi:hypothetical protein